MNTRRANSLRPGQFKHLLRVASVTGHMPVRDVMLLWAHTTGIRVTELALLEVGDVLYPSGAIKPADDDAPLQTGGDQRWQQSLGQANIGCAGARCNG